jgi:predicted PurR-regulated permease PerM
MPPPDGDETGQFARRALLASSLAAAVVVALLLLWYAATVLLLAFAGILLAILLRALSDWLSARVPVSGRWALALVVVTLLGLLALGAWLLGPRLAEQISQLTQRLPESLQQLQQRVEQYGWAQRAVAQAQSWVADMLPSALSMTLGFVGGAVIVGAVGLFLAAQPALYLRGLLRLVPGRARPRAREVLGALGQTLRWWLVGRAVAMVAVWGLTAAGLALLGLPLALSLGLLAGLLTVIPYIGLAVSVAPAVLLALMEGPTLALYVVLLYVGVQTVESYFLTPLVQREVVALPPALTILAVVLFGLLFGFLGLLLATPLAAVAMVLAQRLCAEDALGEPPHVPERPAARRGLRRTKGAP